MAQAAAGLHLSQATLYRKIREFGTALSNYGVLKDPDDIYLFNRFEVPMLLEDLATSWALGEGAPTRAGYWQEKAARREKILDAAFAEIGE